MGFIGKTLNFFRKWASQGILKVSTSDPYTGKSYKMETSLDDFITNFGSASIEMGPSFVEIIARKGANRGSPSTETKIKLDGTTITLEGPEVIAPITKMLKTFMDGVNLLSQTEINLGTEDGTITMLVTRPSGGYALNLGENQFEVNLTTPTSICFLRIINNTFLLNIDSASGTSIIMCRNGQFSITLDSPSAGVLTELTLDAVSLQTLKTLLGL